MASRVAWLARLLRSESIHLSRYHLCACRVVSEVLYRDTCYLVGVVRVLWRTRVVVVVIRPEKSGDCSNLIASRLFGCK